MISAIIFAAAMSGSLPTPKECVDFPCGAPFTLEQDRSKREDYPYFIVPRSQERLRVYANGRHKCFGKRLNRKEAEKVIALEYVAIYLALCNPPARGTAP